MERQTIAVDSMKQEDKSESELIKLTCYDFKLSEPLGVVRKSTDDADAPVSWWKALCLCPLIPEDDPQVQIFKTEHEKYKAKQHRKSKQVSAGPVAEGLEARPPSIMADISLDRNRHATRWNERASRRLQ